MPTVPRPIPASTCARPTGTGGGCCAGFAPWAVACWSAAATTRCSGSWKSPGRRQLGPPGPGAGRIDLKSAPESGPGARVTNMGRDRMSFLKHTGLRALGTAAMAAVVLGGCSGGSSNDALPLVRATLSIKSVSEAGACESVRIRMTPKELIGKSNKYSNNKMMVAEVNMTGPTDENGAPMCNGTGETLPLATGNWEFSAPLASGAVTC